MCKSYISPQKGKNQLLSNFDRLSQQLLKEIRYPACCLCFMQVAESWQGGPFSTIWTSESVFFPIFCQHTLPHNPGFSVHVWTHACAQRHLCSCGHVCLHLLHRGCLFKIFAYRNRNPWFFLKMEKTSSPVLPSDLFICCIKWEGIK